MSNQHSPRCPRCGGRLFLESEFQGKRLLHLWECSLGCSRQFDLEGRLWSHLASSKPAKVVRELSPLR